VLGGLGGRRRGVIIESGAGDRPLFDFTKLHWSEGVGFAGSAVLLGSLFMPWFSTSCAHINPASPSGCNTNSVLTGGVNNPHSYGDFTAFQTFKLLDVILVLACIAPFVLAYIIVRSHELTWRPGEVTMIVGMVATVLILLNGVILGKPGDSVDISLEYGWFVGLIGAVLISFGGTLRQALTGRARKPPGVL
jgi:hypothetical protein